MKTFHTATLFLVVLCISSYISLAPSQLLAASYKDSCKVIGESGGALVESSAQYKEAVADTDISQECLDFGRSVSSTVCYQIQNNGTVQIYYHRWFKPGSDEAKDHCHYKCMGDADSGCEAACSKKPVQLGTNIGSIPCAAGSSKPGKKK